MHEDPRNDSDGDVFRERIVHSSRDTESPVRYVTVAGDEEGYPNESELFGDHRENEVPLHFREVSEFLNRFSKPQSEESPATDGDEPLLGLEIDRPVRYGGLVIGQKVIDAFGDVRERIALFPFGNFSKTVNGRREKHENESGNENVFRISPSDEKHDDRYRSDKQYRTEVRLERQKKDDGSKKRHVRQVPSFEGRDFRAPPLQEIREIQDGSKFDEFHRLKRERKEGDVNPSLRAVVHDSDGEYDDKRNQSSEENMFRVFFKNRIRRLYDEREEEQSDKNVRDIAHEIEMVVRLGQLSRRDHERSHLERRVDAHGADHDHSEDDQGENDEKNTVIDAFRFQCGHARSIRLRKERGFESRFRRKRRRR